MTETTRRPGRRATAGGAIPPQSKDARMAELEARLARLEGVPGLRERGRGLMYRVMPAEAGEHFRNAGREQLLGVRSIVDFWIARLDEADTRAAGRSREAGRSRGRETIDIE
jgi:hypothetical protein